MNSEKIRLIEESFNKGAYSIAFELSSAHVHAGDANGLILLYRTFSELGLKSVDAIEIPMVRSNLSFGFNHLCDDSPLLSDIELRFKYAFNMCLSIRKALINSFNILDQELKSQYQGSTGISFDSDDPAEKEKRNREQAFNNNINARRHALKKRLDTTVSCIFETAFSSVFNSSELNRDKHQISLDFLRTLELAAEHADSSLAKSVKNYIDGVKRIRNERFWQENSALYTSLTEEKAQLSKKIDAVINALISSAENIISTAKAAKDDATKERKRYSLFNHQDRSPLTKTIAIRRAEIKAATKKIKELKEGICPQCEPLRTRIKEIEDELSRQR